jgi:hypothetical protein
MKPNDRTVKLSWREFDSRISEWVNNYILKSSYWSINGQPVCAFLNLSDFCDKYSVGAFGVMLEYCALLVEKHCGARPYLIGIIGEGSDKNIELSNVLPLDAVTGYGLLPNWRGPAVQSYEHLIMQRISDWNRIQSHIRIPFYPVVCAGWDATVRGKCLGKTSSRRGYPDSPVVTGVSATAFGRFLDEAIEFNKQWKHAENVIFLHAWNEWTESSVIEPSDRFGFDFLNEITLRTAQAHLSDLSEQRIVL